MNKSADVVVIGAGVVGCSVAYYLAKEGLRVTVLEREAIGSGASAHATGSLGLLGAEFSPGPSFEMARASFAEFRELVPELESAAGMDLLYQRRPSLRLALDDEEADLIKSFMVWQQPHVVIRWIDAREVHEIEPRLTPSIVGAVYEDESAQLDSYRLNLALGRGAELLGATILNREVTGLVAQRLRDYRRHHRVRSPYTAEAVVVAAGTWSRAFTLPGWASLFRSARSRASDCCSATLASHCPVLISSPKRGHMISRMDGFTSVGSTGGRDYDRQGAVLG